jgi:hypothetical protein
MNLGRGRKGTDQTYGAGSADMVRIEAGLTLAVTISGNCRSVLERVTVPPAQDHDFMAWMPIRRKHPMKKLVGLEIDSNVDVDTVIASISARSSEK